MTKTTYDVIKSITDKQNRMDCKETLKVITHNFWLFASWGTSQKVNIDDKGLILKVSGHHHKGYVLITLSYDDTYRVDIISTHGNILNTYEMVYFDQLFEIIDNRIERIPEYVR